MGPVKEILRAYDEGYRALRLSGRSLYDLVVDDGKMRPLIEALRQAFRTKFGMHMVTYSLAGGLDWDPSRIKDQNDRRLIEKALRDHHLLDIPKDQNEVVCVIRGISSLSRDSMDTRKWADGRTIRFAFLFEFTEHLMPGSLMNGTQTDPQLVAIELAHLTANSLALRSSGNLVLFHGRDGLIDELVCGALRAIRLRQPDITEKKEVLTVALSLYTGAGFEDGLSVSAVANLTTNTPNRGLEQLLRASHYSGRKLTGKELSEQKNRDVESLSENTLTVLDTSGVDNLQLRGLTTEIPLKILERYANTLMNGDSSMPANVLLVGPPGTGKTDLALITAFRAKAAAYQMHSPKGGIVGETERKARLQQTVLREWIPNIAFCDEITEALPLQRNDFDGDSGASRAVTAALLTALSDEGRRGKSLLIATTNCPWRMGAAMRSRFTILPVFHPLRCDFADIVLTTAKRVDRGNDIDGNDERIGEASTIFYEKGANPRHIRLALSNALQLHGSMTVETVLFAAKDLCCSADLPSAIYADLWAVKVTSSRSFLPWNNDPRSYPFPTHLDGVVDLATGDINHSELDKRIKEYEPYANL
jgi:ATPase family associated with various cellular activities (AAA)